MTPTIEIAQRDFERLQSLATPFVDTPATVVSRLIDAFEQQVTVSKREEVKATSLGNTFFGPDLPPLRHTKFRGGEFGGRRPLKPQWNSLVETALILGFEQFGDVRKLHQKSGANVVSGRKIDQGYAYLSEYDFSYQRVSAEDAAKILVKLSDALRVDAKIEFEWRDKPDAYKPMETGRIVLSAII